MGGSPTNNKGTLVIAPVRPFGVNDTFPTAFAKEIKGGVHAVVSTTKRDAIPEDRREWGMFVYVENTPPSVPGVLYQLTDIEAGHSLASNGANWVEFTAEINNNIAYLRNQLNVIMTGN